jgi:molecular chaperone GrpE
MTPDAEQDPSALEHAPDGEPDGPGPEPDLAALHAKAAERDDYLDRLQRTMAEFQNYRQRVTREKGDLRRFVVVDVVRAVLPALDNLERAVVAGRTSDDDPVVAGVRMVLEQLHRVLDDLGVRPIEASNAKFDPGRMEAVARVETADADENTVLEVLETGYRLEDLVIRPARVVVAARVPDRA